MNIGGIIMTKALDVHVVLRYVSSKAITDRFRNSAKGHDLRELVAKFITAYRAVATADM